MKTFLFIHTSSATFHDQWSLSLSYVFAPDWLPSIVSPSLSCLKSHALAGRPCSSPLPPLFGNRHATFSPPPSPNRENSAERVIVESHPTSSKQGFKGARMKQQQQQPETDSCMW